MTESYVLIISLNEAQSLVEFNLYPELSAEELQDILHVALNELISIRMINFDILGPINYQDTVIRLEHYIELAEVRVDDTGFGICTPNIE